MLVCSVLAIACKGGDDDGVTNNLSLNKYEITIEVGKEETLVCTVEDGSSCTWATSDESVATVVDGVVTALKVGSAEISATANGETVSCAVTVISANVSNANFTVDKKTASIFKGHTLTIKPSLIFGSDEIQINAQDVTWSTSDANIATVTGGVVTGVNVGVVTITATYVYNGTTLTASSEFTVKELLFVEFAKDYPSEIKLATNITVSGKSNDKNTTTTLEYKVLDDKDNDVTSSIDKSKLQFISSDQNVATIDANGSITAVAPGKSTVSIGCQGSTISVDVIVMTAIAEKSDLDKIAFAWKDDNVGLWSKSYILVDDIDYEGDQIIPIAPYVTDGSTSWDSLYANSEWGKLNHTTSPAFFSGTIDGDGYAIKNGRLAFNYIYTGSESLLSCFIGGLTGTLKNIAFIGLQPENPTEVNNWAEGRSLTQDKDAWYNHSGLVYVVKPGGVVENVYVDMLSGAMAKDNGYGVIAYRIQTGGVARNCVAKVTFKGKWDYNQVEAARGTGMFGEMTDRIQNCFMIKPGNHERINFISGHPGAFGEGVMAGWNAGRKYTTYADLNAAQASVLSTYGGAWSYVDGVLKLGSHVVG